MFKSQAHHFTMRTAGWSSRTCTSAQKLWIPAVGSCSACVRRQPRGALASFSLVRLPLLFPIHLQHIVGYLGLHTCIRRSVACACIAETYWEPLRASVMPSLLGPPLQQTPNACSPGPFALSCHDIAGAAPRAPGDSGMRGARCRWPR